MDVLVTGGAGFVGGHLVSRLVGQGHHVTVIDDLSNGRLENLAGVLDRILFVKKDITEPPDQWFDHKPTPFHAIYNLACWPRSRSFQYPKRDIEVNVIGMVHAIQLALACKARILFSSNSGIYDTGQIPICELTEDNPKTPYDLDKLQAEQFLKLYGATFDLDYVIFRFATVYGPRQRVSGEWKPVVMEFITKLRAGEAPVIHWDGNQTRDLIYVEDLTEALVLALDNPKANRETMILGSGVETSINQLYEMVSRQLGIHREPIRKPMVLGDIARMRYDCTKADQILGWKAGTSLEEGIHRIINANGT